MTEGFVRPPAPPHLRGTMVQRCACGFVGNAWAVAGHRGRRLSVRCSNPPTPVDADRLECILRIERDAGTLDFNDLDQTSKVTQLLLTFYGKLRRGDLIALMLDDLEVHRDDAVLLRIRRTGRAARIGCIDEQHPTFLCPKCMLELYVVLRREQGPPGPGALFLCTSPRCDIWT